METTPRTLLSHLQHNARTQPDALCARFLFQDRAPVETDYRATEVRTRQYAALYAARGVKKGEVVLMILEHHEDLMPAFLGAMWLGAIPAFLPYPTIKLEPRRYYAHLSALIERSRPVAVLTEPPVRDILAETLPVGEGRPALLVRAEVPTEPIAGDPAPHGPEDVALLQFSSGSTGLQKGAALSHRAVLAEIDGVGEFFAITRQDRFITWVPLYHDWGLVCVALHAIVLGLEYTLISPVHWVAAPASAFQAIHCYQGTIYYLPNFAFNLMTRRIKDKELDGVDLSHLRLCCNGAEPCFYDSHERFAVRFAPWGFKREALGIVYGMAEVTNSVFAAGRDEPIQVDCVDRFVLQREQRAAEVPDEHPHAQRLLSVGRALRGTAFKVVDDARKEVPERHVGEVAIRSRASFHGYHNNPEATAQAVDEDGFYHSGDMGYRIGDKLVITGRKSDRIIASGVNIYPQDIEAIVSEHPAVVAGRVAAIGVDDAEVGTQRIILIVESRSTDPETLADIARQARPGRAAAPGGDKPDLPCAVHVADQDIEREDRADTQLPAGRGAAHRSRGASLSRALIIVSASSSDSSLTCTTSSAAATIACWAGSPRIASAKAATVGRSSMARSGSSARSRSRRRVITWIASSEWPPSAKKSSWTDTRGTSRTSAQMLATASSTTSRGATGEAPGAPARTASSGGGSARRSILPFGVSGSASRKTNVAGIM